MPIPMFLPISSQTAQGIDAWLDWLGAHRREDFRMRLRTDAKFFAPGL